MGDYGVQYPLWSPMGLLPEDADWLTANLKLTPSVIERLERWQARWESSGTDRGDYEWLKSEGIALLDQLKLASPDITFEFIPDRPRESGSPSDD